MAKVGDMGLANMETIDGVVGVLGGTPTHMAPEVVIHRKVSTSRSESSSGGSSGGITCRDTNTHGTRSSDTQEGEY
jgi:hypothetical protein